MLGNEVGRLGLSKERLLDYCLMIGEWRIAPLLHASKAYADDSSLPERHPDNVAASLFGGFVGTYLNELKPEDVARKEIPLSEVLPAPAGGIDTGNRPPAPPLGIGHYRKFHWAKEIKAIAIIPDFVVPTANARNVLPQSYSRADVVCILHYHNGSVANWGHIRSSIYSARPCCPPHWGVRRPIPT
jgi:homoserine kinase